MSQGSRSYPVDMINFTDPFTNNELLAQVTRSGLRANTLSAQAQLLWVCLLLPGLLPESSKALVVGLGDRLDHPPTTRRVAPRANPPPTPHPHKSTSDPERNAQIWRRHPVFRLTYLHDGAREGFRAWLADARLHPQGNQSRFGAGLLPPRASRTCRRRPPTMRGERGTATAPMRAASRSACGCRGSTACGTSRCGRSLGGSRRRGWPRPGRRPRP